MEHAVKLCIMCKSGTNGFYKDKTRKDGLNPRCTVCDRTQSKAWAERNREQSNNIKQAYKRRDKERNRLANKRSRVKVAYGLTLDEYESLMKNPCQICGLRTERMHLDHCHQSGQVRGVLCRNCNVALGLMADNPERLRRAAEYLEVKHGNY
jgi:hypothetical protein